MGPRAGDVLRVSTSSKKPCVSILEKKPVTGENSSIGEMEGVAATNSQKDGRKEGYRKETQGSGSWHRTAGEEVTS